MATLRLWRPIPVYIAAVAVVARRYSEVIGGRKPTACFRHLRRDASTRPLTQENLITAARAAVVVKLYLLGSEPDTTVPVVKRLRTQHKLVVSIPIQPVPPLCVDELQY